MAGPSVMVKILGDLTGLGKSADEAGGKMETAGQRMHSAFSGVLDQLNSAGVLGPFGTALSSADSALSKVSGHAGEIGPALMGAGGAVAGLGLALQAAGSSDQAAHQQLQASVEATGHSYDQYGDKVEAAIKHQEHFGTTADTTQDTLRILTQATGDPTKALGLLNTASDLAAAKHETLSTAAESLGKVYNGNTRILKEFGIQTTNTAGAHKALESATTGAANADKAAADANQHLADVHAELAGKTNLTATEQIRLRDATEKAADAADKAKAAHEKLTQAHKDNADAAGAHERAIDTLGKKLSGQASAQADTFTGKIKSIKAAFEDHIAQLGQKYGPALTAAGAAMTGAGAAMEVGKGAMEAYKGATKDMTAAQWLLNAAEDANPIMLIVLAAAALAVGLVLLYKHSQEFRDIVKEIGKVAGQVWKDIVKGFDDVKAAALVVFGWLEKNWPYILAVLLGPFAVATLLILKNWQTILDFFEGLPKKIAAFLVGIWDTAFAELTTVATWLDTNVWQPVAKFFTAIPANIAKLFVGVWDVAWSAFTTVAVWLYNNVEVPVGHFFGGIPGKIAGEFVGVYDTAFADFKGAATWLESNVWTPISNFFTGLPGRIETAAKGMWHGIATAFESAINAIIRGWNGLQFTVPAIGFGPFKTPAVTVGMPDIPLLSLAQGGLMTSDGLVYAHAGEAITPIPSSVGGPAVHIENAHFATELDVDTFMRRAAWVARTAKL